MPVGKDWVSCSMLQGPVWSGRVVSWLWAGPSARWGPVSSIPRPSGSSESRGQVGRWLPAPPGRGPRSGRAPERCSVCIDTSHPTICFSFDVLGAVILTQRGRRSRRAYPSASRGPEGGEGLTAAPGARRGQLTPHCFPDHGQGWGPQGHPLWFEGGSSACLMFKKQPQDALLWTWK